MPYGLDASRARDVLVNAARNQACVMPTHALTSLFRPRRVALIGASEKSIWSQAIARNFKAYGFTGEVVGINRRGIAAHGLPGFATCRNAGEIDAAFLVVPADALADALRDAAEAGVRAAIIVTSGFSEIGEAGQRQEAALVTTAERLGMRFLGPNSLGFADIARGTAMTAIPPPKPFLPGGIAVISQSGATGAELMNIAHRLNAGLSFIAATGNEAMIGLEDVVDYLVEDPATTVIAAFVESVRRPARFIAAARAARDAGKPFVVLKVGTSPLTAEIAAAHTGALVGDDRVFDAVCAECGVIRVHGLEDLIVTAATFDRMGPVRHNAMGFVAGSGGACALIADAAHVAGLDIPPFAAETQAALKAMLPSYASTLNPLDVTGGYVTQPDILEHALATVARDPAVDRVAIAFDLPDDRQRASGNAAILAAIGRGLSATDPPGALITISQKPFTPDTRAIMAEYGIATVLPGIDGTVRALGRIAAWSTSSTSMAPYPAEAVPHLYTGVWPIGERSVLEMLAVQGVPVVPAILAASPRAASDAAAAFGGTVALKIQSPDIAHKTEAGGVRLGVAPHEAETTYAAILASVSAFSPLARIDGVAVSPMRGGGIELIVGVVRDPVWGLILAVGLGGIWVELLRDSALARLPVSPARAVELVRSLRGARLLQGYRGAAPVDMAALGRIIASIGDAAIALGPSLASLEVNPLLCGGDRIEALDALAIREADMPAGGETS